MYNNIAPNIGVYNCQIGVIAIQQKMEKQLLLISKGNIHSWRNGLSEYPCQMNCIFYVNLWVKCSLWMDYIKYSLCVVWWAVQYFSWTTTELWRVHYVVAPSHWHKQCSVADQFCWQKFILRGQRQEAITPNKPKLKKTAACVFSRDISCVLSAYLLITNSKTYYLNDFFIT